MANILHPLNESLISSVSSVSSSVSSYITAIVAELTFDWTVLAILVQSSNDWAMIAILFQSKVNPATIEKFPKSCAMAMCSTNLLDAEASLCPTRVHPC